LRRKKTEAAMNTITLQQFKEYEGRELEPTEWISIEQDRVAKFADCTDDHQFIHLDPARARLETPFGGTIAHGFLLLSLISAHQPPDLPRIKGTVFVLNYGLDRVRFLSVVRTGARVRIRTRIASITEKEPGRVLVKSEKTMEVEDGAKPAYVAEQLFMYILEGAD
jgi:acyl dehydratase